MPLFGLSKNLFFDRVAEVTKAGKTSNSTPKCMWILERGELRSKAKRLASQGIWEHFSPPGFANAQPPLINAGGKEAVDVFSVLPV